MYELILRFFFNLSEPLIRIAKEGAVTIWYTPQQTGPACVVDGQHGFEVFRQKDETFGDGEHEDIGYFYNAPAEAQRLERETDELPSVRILPEELDELAGMIEDCKRITMKFTPLGSQRTLTELDTSVRHPVAIFSHFANRRGLP